MRLRAFVSLRPTQGGSPESGNRRTPGPAALADLVILSVDRAGVEE